MIGATVSVNVTLSAAGRSAAVAVSSPIRLVRMALLSRFGPCLGLELEVVVIRVGADPSPSDFSRLHLANRSVSIADSDRVQIICTLEPAKANRMVTSNRG